MSLFNAFMSLSGAYDADVGPGAPPAPRPRSGRSGGWGKYFEINVK